MRSQQFFHALFVLVLLTAGVFAQSGAGDKERNKERLIKVTQFLEKIHSMRMQRIFAPGPLNM